MVNVVYGVRHEAGRGVVVEQAAAIEVNVERPRVVREKFRKEEVGVELVDGGARVREVPVELQLVGIEGDGRGLHDRLRRLDPITDAVRYVQGGV